MVQHDEFEGVANVTAPEAVTNRDLMAALREAAGMPLGLPASRRMLELGAWMLRSETELVTKSRWVVPRRLQRHGFRFRWPRPRHRPRQTRAAATPRSPDFTTKKSVPAK